MGTLVPKEYSWHSCGKKYYMLISKVMKELFEGNIRAPAPIEIAGFEKEI
jgi:hypothetical protein